MATKPGTRTELRTDGGTDRIDGSVGIGESTRSRGCSAFARGTEHWDRSLPVGEDTGPTLRALAPDSVATRGTFYGRRLEDSELEPIRPPALEAEVIT